MTEKRDWGFVAIVGVVGAVAVWLLLMPFVPAIASCTLHRFHLRSSSFIGWMAQQPIPSMYNFCNRVEVRSLPPQASLEGLIDPLLLDPLMNGPVTNGPTDHSSLGQLMTITLNHFPTRIFTFGDSRLCWLESGEPRWFVLRSSYRNQMIESVYFVQRKTDGRWFATLEPSIAPEPETP